MSDEEEMRRYAGAYAGTQGVGEMLVDLDEEYRELGIEKV